MVCCADTASHADKAGSDGVAKLSVKSANVGLVNIDFHTQTHIQDCHHERPSTMFADEIIQVLMLKESAAQY